jgi:hypothetical protein
VPDQSPDTPAMSASDLADARRFLECVLDWRSGGWNTIHWETAKGWRSESYRNIDAMVARVAQLGGRYAVYVSPFSQASPAGHPDLDRSDLIHPHARRTS